MNIIKIEPTPNPNTMKVVLDEQKPDMKSSTHKEVSPENPDFINRVLEIDEVTSVFYALDFISVDKDPRAEWDVVIPKIEAQFEGQDTKK
ncbi:MULTISPECIES: NifU N-terminal domain-containing protein [Nosocomiicoccus]|uniref:NifU N-terminal domain-containing protein n=1 Tax=Nosocomiicoccus TaxID=489909 RepID=UPI00041A1093|nr:MULTISPECIES: NifU N-terminal domain-containing protein [Nosocomiicoccus]